MPFPSGGIRGWFIVGTDGKVKGLGGSSSSNLADAPDYPAAIVAAGAWSPLMSGPTSALYHVQTLGGERFSFVTPGGVDTYPSGATVDKLVPGSWPVTFPFLEGAYMLVALARVSGAGGRAKVGLFNLDDDPDTPVAELEFANDDEVGERLVSDPFVPVEGALYGVKVTTDDVGVQGAAWGCQIVRSGVSELVVDPDGDVIPVWVPGA